MREHGRRRRDAHWSECLAHMGESGRDHDSYAVVDRCVFAARPSRASLSEGADLTVVGRHQRGLVGRLWTGSLSGSVLQHGHGPIAIVPGPERCT